MMSDDEILLVVKAHKEGKKIQVLAIHSDLGWQDCRNPSWNFGTTTYRVAPEPRKPKQWWLEFKDGGTHAEVHFNNYCGDCVHVQEIEGATSGEPSVASDTVRASQEINSPRKPREWRLPASLLDSTDIIKQIVNNGEPEITVREVWND